MKYTSNENIKELLAQLDIQLSQLEVKGESVMILANTRNLLKHIHDSLKEDKEKQEGG